MTDRDVEPSSPNPSSPAWLNTLVGAPEAPIEGSSFEAKGREYVFQHGIWRDRGLLSDTQSQTADTFGFKWAQSESFGSESSAERMGSWLREKYGDVDRATWWSEYGDSPLLLDAGCGAAFSGIELFGSILDKVRYLGVDVSTAVDVAAERLADRGLRGALFQADLTRLPIAPGAVDVIFSEGVLHHTDSTEGALRALVPLLAPGGRIMFYVYRTKGPVREFTDDYIRDLLQPMAPQEAWDALIPLSKLGELLGELDIQVDVPEAIDVLEIPAGKIDLQRLFYWHVCKAFYAPGMTIDEMNHINYDWFAPANAARQTEQEVSAWCEDLGLEIEHQTVEEAGITTIARLDPSRR